MEGDRAERLHPPSYVLLLSLVHLGVPVADAGVSVTACQSAVESNPGIFSCCWCVTLLNICTFVVLRRQVWLKWSHCDGLPRSSSLSDVDTRSSAPGEHLSATTRGEESPSGTSFAVSEKLVHHSWENMSSQLLYGLKHSVGIGT